MPSPRVYIVVLNYNGWRDTIECLESALQLEYDNYSIVVVDNGSKDGSIEQINAWAKGNLEATVSEDPLISQWTLPKVTKPLDIAIIQNESKFTSLKSNLVLIQTNQNKGFSSGNNVGIRYALHQGDAEYIWLLNNDTIVPHNTLNALIKNYKDKPNLGILGLRLINYYNSATQQAFAGKLNMFTCTPVHIGEDEPLDNIKEYTANEYDYVLGASMFVPKKFVEDVGLLDEKYFLYFEELDWTCRGKKRGWQSIVDSNSYIYHKHGGTTGNSNVNNKSVFADKTLLESKIRFLKKVYPYLLPIPFFTFPIVILNRLKRGQGDRVFTLSKSLIKALFS